MMLYMFIVQSNSRIRKPAEKYSSNEKRKTFMDSVLVAKKEKKKLTCFTFQMGIQFFIASFSCHYYPKSFRKNQFISYED